MADRYEWDRDRDRDREFDRDRESNRREWDRGRESRNFGSQSGYGQGGQNQGGYGQSGSQDWDRERRWNQGQGGNEGWNREREGWNRGRDDWRRDQYSSGDRYRGENTGGRFTENAEQGDWGRQGNWGSFGNRSDYNREGNWGGRGNFGGNRENLGGNRSGYESGRSEFGREHEFNRQGQFGRSGSYEGGMGSFGGGMSQYGERGRFSGRGPKGWQRSDERIREDVNERLSDHPHIDASEIEVTVKNGEVTLTGTIDDRNMKRQAEEVAEQVSGVKDVHNQIRVRQGSLQTQGTGTQAMTTGGSTKQK